MVLGNIKSLSIKISLVFLWSWCTNNYTINYTKGTTKSSSISFVMIFLGVRPPHFPVHSHPKTPETCILQYVQTVRQYLWLKFLFIFLFSASSNTNIWSNLTDNQVTILPVVTTQQTSERKVFCRAKRPTDPQLYSAWSLPNWLLCLLESLKFILHPNTRTWSMTTHKRHSAVTGVPYPHNLERHGAWRKTFALQKMKRGREEKTVKIVI